MKAEQNIVKGYFQYLLESNTVAMKFEIAALYHNISWRKVNPPMYECSRVAAVDLCLRIISDSIDKPAVMRCSFNHTVVLPETKQVSGVVARVS